MTLCYGVLRYDDFTALVLVNLATNTTKHKLVEKPNV